MLKESRSPGSAPRSEVLFFLRYVYWDLMITEGCIELNNSQVMFI